MKGEQQSVANSIRKLKFEKAINDKEMLMWARTSMTL
jgi:hypothetical protein